MTKFEEMQEDFIKLTNDLSDADSVFQRLVEEYGRSFESEQMFAAWDAFNSALSAFEDEYLSLAEA